MSPSKGEHASPGRTQRGAPSFLHVPPSAAQSNSDTFAVSQTARTLPTHDTLVFGPHGL
jgi:hypothetical protein